jgi:hypothetical protein
MNKVVDHRIGLYIQSAEMRGYNALGKKFNHFFKGVDKIGEA